MDHWAEPVNTERNGGENSYERPKVRILQDSCIFAIRTGIVAKIIPAGVAEGLRGYTYFAQICSDPAVCENKCTYACCEPIIAGCTSCNATVGCDQNVTSVAMYGCENNKTDEFPNGHMIGICAYRSTKPSAIDALRDFFKFIYVDHNLLWTVDQAKAAAKQDCAKIDGFERIEGPTEKDPGCFPVSVAPMPPPFGLGPMTQPLQVSIYKICSEEDLDDSRKPVSLLSDYLARPVKACVLPEDPSRPENYSTYSKPCVRVTFEEPKEEDGSLPSDDPGSFVEVAGKIYEKLYKFIISIAYEGGQSRIVKNTTRNIAIKDNLNESNITFEKPTPYGYNDSAFIDLCGNVSLDGTPTSESRTIMDPRTKIDRKFKLAVTAEQVCVQEEVNSVIVERGCVPRPNMKQPVVAFCEAQTINDQSKACIQVRLPDFQQAGYTYKFMGSPSKCTDEDAMCLINSTQDGQVNNFGFTAISTNDCYINRSYGLNTSKCPDDSTDLCDCADSSDLCMAQCEACNFTNMCYYRNKKTITGVTKLCLVGYLDTYAALSPVWCTRNCNRICAKLRPGPQIPGQVVPDVADPASGGRVNNQTPGVTDCCSCTTDHDPTSTQDRIKNPVEAGLCVDVYPFSFKDCQANTGGTERAPTICNIMQKFCGMRKSEQPESEQSVVQEYKNFADCIAVFKACSTVEDPSITLDQVLPDGMDVPDDLLSEMSKAGLTMPNMGCVLLNSFINMYPFTGGVS